MKINILGVQIDTLTKSEVLEKIKEFLLGGQHYIVTPNPEMIIAAESDAEFLEILNKADLAAPDGTGLIFASRYLNRRLKERVVGIDLMLDICRLAEQENCSIYLLGGEEGVARRTAEVLTRKFPRLRMAGAESGGLIPNSQFPISNSRIIDRINRVKPDILFVAFGAPKQEKWIAHNLFSLPSVKLAMGVGGAFDFIAGKVKRAPKFIRKLGLEWLWRLVKQPWRWKRILIATIKFSWRVIKGEKIDPSP